MGSRWRRRAVASGNTVNNYSRKAFYQCNGHEWLQLIRAGRMEISPRKGDPCVFVRPYSFRSSHRARSMRPSSTRNQTLRFSIPTANPSPLLSLSYRTFVSIEFEYIISTNNLGEKVRLSDSERSTRNNDENRVSVD